ncbi:Hypothetical predicted protein [Mytilus galloprovincialis]|uniref:Protein quiver n=1 Tax=Mytilus galloprovincialis TaxID=29158 RepID=A0A8B6GGS2_MYTGA|nr:Hypothetical predicted protein [Mytilus galloprovincialis]
MKRMIYFIVVFFIFKTVHSTLCYECVSLNEEWCTEYFDDSLSYHKNIINCTGNCMKLIAHVDKEKEFYVRTCDITQGVSGTCTTASQVLGIPVSTVCVCGTDGCNKAYTTRNDYLSTICSILVSFLYIYTN